MLSKPVALTVYQADMDDAVSLRSAVAGSNAVFAMTNCKCWILRPAAAGAPIFMSD